MIVKKIVLILFAVVCISTTAICKIYFPNNDDDVIINYLPTFIPSHDRKGHLYIVIRTYDIEREHYFLAVDPYTLNTIRAPARNFSPSSFLSMHEIKNTPYMKMLSAYAAAPYPLQNDGMTRANHPVQGQFLTIDMCPSSKPFEKEFFKALVAKAEQSHHPIPIAIAVTGLWIIHHPHEFDWLIMQGKQHKLLITWINHSFSHPFYQDLPLQENFLMTLPEYFSEEVLNTEKMLIAHHQIPSIFFRFPGLVSNEELVTKLKKLGLIAIGSDAWLAKEQPVEQGSIILVHGNANEPDGIKKIMPLLLQPGLNLLPLCQVYDNL